VDSRLPVEARTQNVPTPKQMLYGSRATIRALREERDAADRVVSVWLELEMRTSFGGSNMRGFVFVARDRPFEDDTLYTIDPDPNDWYGYWGAQVTAGLGAGGANTLYERLINRSPALVTWPEAAAAGQARFLAGLEALRLAGVLPAFETGKRDFIGAQGTTPILLVQGPPGTGKSFTTAFAILARLQGALAAGQPCRVIVSCKTHAATDVLLRKVVETQTLLSDARRSHPALMAEYFDPRVLAAPLFRAGPKSSAPSGTQALPRKRDQEKGAVSAWRHLEDTPWCVVGATPGGVYGLVTDRWAKDLFGHDLCHCLVLDEASQLSLPEAIMAALPLAASGQIVVVGDHRQMPPIVKHDWGNEPRRTFTTFRVYESLFTTLLALIPPPPMIKFEESFRLHAEMAAFLRREIYARDGIDYFSRKRATLPPLVLADSFVAAVLAPEHTLVVVVHEEASSQHRNTFEQSLLVPLLEVLAGEHGLDPEDGVGVVVPHRAQRAALREAVPALTRRDPDTGAITFSAVNTVERFQGDEREVILVGATESDPDYLLLAGEFLLDPRRLTVALSRAKQKMVLVASRSVFTVFPSDEETFAHAQLWKNLLRRTCTTLLWAGERDGTGVQVWGNGAIPYFSRPTAAAAARSQPPRQ
ncbi:MAG TPA: ATP-binding protein, partial [Chloroflexota bacterium]|nr:ATP-binding protein [Chloroflexota bacterium]